MFLIKAAIFDLDNTLYDYDSCNNIAEQKLVSQISMWSDCSEQAACVILGKAKETIKYRLGNVAASHNRLLYMQNICEQLGLNPVHYALDLYSLYWDTILHEMTAYEYVLPTFAWLHSRHIKIGILTDLTAHIQYRKLRTLGIASEIDMIVTSEEAGEEKPSAKMFRLMAEKCEESFEDMIMIGDSQSKDIAGAAACGMKGLLYIPGMDVRKELEKR